MFWTKSTSLIIESQNLTDRFSYVFGWISVPSSSPFVNYLVTVLVSSSLHQFWQQLYKDLTFVYLTNPKLLLQSNLISGCVIVNTIKRATEISHEFITQLSDSFPITIGWGRLLVWALLGENNALSFPLRNASAKYQLRLWYGFGCFYDLTFGLASTGKSKGGRRRVWFRGRGPFSRLSGFGALRWTFLWQ